MIFEFTVRGDRLVADKDYSFVEGNQNVYKAKFTLDDAWTDEFDVMCVVYSNDKKLVPVPVVHGECLLPKFAVGSARIGLVGIMGEDDGETPIISTNWVKIGVDKGANNGDVNESFNESVAEIWHQYYSRMEENRKASEVAAERAEAQADRIKNLDVSAEEGIQAAVTKTETEDGISLKFTLPKGEKGDEGPKGDTGERGPQGIQGPKGDKGDQGDRGPAGEKGADGHTPVKGVDYFTPEDIAELNIPSKEYIENIENDATSAKTEAMANTAFRVQADKEIKALLKDVDAHQQWLESNDTKHGNFETEITNLKNQIGDIDSALEELHNYAQALIGGAE